MTVKNAAYYIDQLGLEAHIEGGAFRQTYKSSGTLAQAALPAAFAGDRHFSTAIYFLLQAGEFSALHRLASDELWHFYEGEVLSIYEFEANGQLRVHQLGRDLQAAQQLQVVVQAGSWFGSRCEVPGGFSLVGCTVAPGFEYDDFCLAAAADLITHYPQHAVLIRELCRR